MCRDAPDAWIRGLVHPVAQPATLQVTDGDERVEQVFAATKLIELLTFTRLGLMKMSVITGRLYGTAPSLLHRPDQGVARDHRSGLGVRCRAPDGPPRAGSRPTESRPHSSRALRTTLRPARAVRCRPAGRTARSSPCLRPLRSTAAAKCLGGIGCAILDRDVAACAGQRVDAGEQLLLGSGRQVDQQAFGDPGRRPRCHRNRGPATPAASLLEGRWRSLGDRHSAWPLARRAPRA